MFHRWTYCYQGRKRKLQEKGMSRGGRHAGDEDEDEEESGGYGAPDGQETKKKKRRKGAPKEMPSNKPVSRLRTVVEPPPKPKSRGVSCSEGLLLSSLPRLSSTCLCCDWSRPSF